MTLPPRASTEPPARRLDRAVDALLTDGRAVVDPSLRPLIEAAAAIRAALPLLHPGVFFEQRVARRLAAPRTSWLSLQLVPLAPSALRARGVIPQHRLLITGAFGSAAVGVAGATAYVVWRANRRHS